MAQSLKQRIIQSGSWTIAGHGMSLAIRLGSSLILTRILFPEAFGLMMTAQSIIIGIAMLSDISISQALVQSDKGEDEDYVNTAWTIQILQAVIASAFICAFSPLVASYFNQPLLKPILWLAALGNIISGIQSTNTALADRKLEARRVTLIELAGQAITAASSIIIANNYPSPVALVIGNIVGATTGSILSHTILGGHKNRLRWNKAAAKSIVSFGSKISLSSALTFLSGEGSRLLLASLVTPKALAMMALSGNINLIAWQIIQKLSSRVLFPTYSEICRSAPERLREVVQKFRILQIGVCVSTSLLLVALAHDIINLMYDERYSVVSDILRIHATGMLVSILNGSYVGVLWAMNKVNTSTRLLAVQTCIQWSCVFLGYKFFGTTGVIIGNTFSTCIMYPVNAATYYKLGLWYPKIDAPVLLTGLASIAYISNKVDFTKISQL